MFDLSPRSQGAVARFAVLLFMCNFLLPENTAQAQNAASTSLSKGGVVTLKVTGDLSPADREALAALIEPDSVSRLIDTVSKFGVGVAKVCKLSKCSVPDITTILRDPSSLVAGFVVPTMETSRTTELIGARSGPVFVDYNDRFAVIEGKSPVGEAAKWGQEDKEIAKWGAEDKIAVPADRLEENNLSISSGSLVVPPGASKAELSIIERDVKIGGASERQFRLNRLLSQAEVDARVAQLQRSTVVTVDTGPPQETFTFIQFQTTGADCSNRPAAWPFDPATIVQRLKFNDAIRKRLKAGPVRRSRILIVDTGLGKTLALKDSFSPILFADAAEMMAPASAQRQQNGDPVCYDANNNGYWRDVYGTGAGPDRNDDRRCLNPSFDFPDLVQPHPRKSTSQQFYIPDHGSFVATLAAGGPQFIEAFPTVADYLGLTFFRVTRDSKSENLHVENSFSDIALSLEYAKTIGADVINMSLKTARDTAFEKFKQNEFALLVASAGNFAEDLDQNASENRPASLEGFDDRMIVVGALQPNDPDHPFWPDSARSPTHVHIAAPGALISSLGTDGQDLCDSGTSAAAPLVSFTAAMLRSLTGAPREIVRSRLLAAADHEPKLQGMVEDNRRLNVEAALDIFVDRVETDGGLKRGWIEPQSAERLVSVCKPPGIGRLAALRGKIDLSLLWEWWKKPDKQASIRHQIDERHFNLEKCDVPDGTFSFFDLATGVAADIPWSSVKKVLPTPFRAVKAIILKSNDQGEVRQ